MADKKILVINSGSATLKFKVYSYALPQNKTGDFLLTEELTGAVEKIGLTHSFLEIREETSKSFVKQNFPEGLPNHQEAFFYLIKKIKNYLPTIKLVVSRIVHGGGEFNDPVRLSDKSLQHLKKYNKLAPLHNPVNIACAETAMEVAPSAKHYGVFDTGYYQTMPDYAYLYALPLELYRDYGIRRYGFHGISHQYAAMEAARKINKPLSRLKIITCHLGSGASITATKFGQAIDTTMGFSPLEGLTMSTRSGDLDASVPLYMLEELNLTPDDIRYTLNQESGLLALSGTKDMREILTAVGEKVAGYQSEKKFTAEDKSRAALALNMFVYDVVRYIGQFVAIMKGVDVLVFTGGIGERSPVIRQRILKSVRHLGKFQSLVVLANEEKMMAQQILKLQLKK